MIQQMRIVLAHNHFDSDHLAKVQSEMSTLGAPKVRAVWMEAYGVWIAVEGCHRLRAAHALGLTPEIDPVEWSEEMTTEDLATDHEDVWTIAELCERNSNNHILNF